MHKYICINIYAYILCRYVIIIVIMPAVAMRQRVLPFTWLMLSIDLGFSWWYPWTGDEGALSFCDQKTVESRESVLFVWWHPHEVSSPPDILSDQKIFHRWQHCPIEYFLVCHFVHPGYPHDRTQMSHHEGRQLFHLSSVHCPGLGSV